jgi:hypothetical protein
MPPPTMATSAFRSMASGGSFQDSRWSLQACERKVGGELFPQGGLAPEKGGLYKQALLPISFYLPIGSRNNTGEPDTTGPGKVDSA